MTTIPCWLKETYLVGSRKHTLLAQNKLISNCEDDKLYQRSFAGLIIIFRYINEKDFMIAQVNDGLIHQMLTEW